MTTDPRAVIAEKFMRSHRAAPTWRDLSRANAALAALAAAGYSLVRTDGLDRENMAKTMWDSYFGYMTRIPWDRCGYKQEGHYRMADALLAALGIEEAKEV